jgi:hypothetical protein
MVTRKRNAKIKQCKRLSKCPDQLEGLIAKANRLNPQKKRLINQKIAFIDSVNYASEITGAVTDFKSFVNQHEGTLQKYYDSQRDFYTEFGVDPQLHLDVVVDGLVLDVTDENVNGKHELRLGLTESEAEHFRLAWLQAYYEGTGSSYDEKISKFLLAEISATRDILVKVIELLKHSRSKSVRARHNFRWVDDQFSIVAKDNFITVELHPAFDALTGIDLSQLGICKICADVFWGKRRKSVTCSKPCYNVLRQRQYRDGNRDAINAQRRANYNRKRTKR